MSLSSLYDASKLAVDMSELAVKAAEDALTAAKTANTQAKTALDIIKKAMQNDSRKKEIQEQEPSQEVETQVYTNINHQEEEESPRRICKKEMKEPQDVCDRCKKAGCLYGKPLTESIVWHLLAPSCFKQHQIIKLFRYRLPPVSTVIMCTV